MPLLRSDGSDDDDDDEYDPTLMCRSTDATPQATSATVSARATRAQQQSSLVPLTASNVSSSPAAAAVRVVGLVATTAGEREAHSVAAVAAGDGGLRLPCGAGRRGGTTAASAAAARVRCVAMSSAHAVLCAGAEDGQLSMWDFDTARTTRTLQPTRVLTPFVHRIAGLQAIVAMHASCDGAYFVVCQDGDSPALVQARNGKQSGYCAMGERGLVDVVRGKGHCAAVTSSSPHTTHASSFFTAAQDGTARLWDCNTCERGSRYAVQHGSGQLDDRVVVESVCGLTASHLGSSGGDGDVFATGGSDGCVQVWDARTRYRPGGALATWSVYNAHAHTSTTTGRRDDDDVFGGDERHVGGLCEVACGGVAGIAVRAGDTICVYDLRQLRNSGSSSAGGGVTRKGGVVAVPLLAQLADTLPYTLDTTPLVRTRSLACHASAATTTTTSSMSAPHSCSMLTCTSRAGYRHIVGGHVLRLSLRTAAATTTTTLACVRAWRAGRSDEDVLCVCADTSSHASGSDDDDTQLLCAGLSSGVVVVRTSATTAAMTTSHEGEHSHDSSSSSGVGSAVLRCRGRVAEALQRWLTSAPERVTGVKVSRDDGDVDVDASKDEDALY